MFVAIMKIELRFPPVSSIKEKRNIVNSVKMKIFASFKVSVAEVDDQELYNSSVIGISFICLKRDHCVSKGQKIVKFLETNSSEIFYDYDMIIEEH